MKKLDLEKLWKVCNTLSNKELGLSEENCYVSLLGNRSHYCGDTSFEEFLNYYSFKIDGDDTIVFNTDPVPYESWNNDDVSHFPSVLLSFSAEKLESWLEIEIELQLEAQKRERVREKEDLKRKIELLQKQLINL